MTALLHAAPRGALFLAPSWASCPRSCAATSSSPGATGSRSSSEWVGLALQALTFYFVGLMVDPSDAARRTAARRATYMEFVAVGIAIDGVRAARARARRGHGMRGEQMQGTLESLLMTPTSPGDDPARHRRLRPASTSRCGRRSSSCWSRSPSGSTSTRRVRPGARRALVAFIPFVWGLGVASAGVTLTFRRGGGAAALAARRCSPSSRGRTSRSTSCPTGSRRSPS